MKIYIGIYQNVTFGEVPFAEFIKKEPLNVLYKECQSDSEIGKVYGHLDRNRPSDSWKLIDIIEYTVKTA